LPKWRGISGLPTKHRIWYGETLGRGEPARSREGAAVHEHNLDIAEIIIADGPAVIPHRDVGIGEPLAGRFGGRIMP
jgi:hypothetical protein